MYNGAGLTEENTANKKGPNKGIAVYTVDPHLIEVGKLRLDVAWISRSNLVS